MQDHNKIEDDTGPQVNLGSSLSSAFNQLCDLGQVTSPATVPLCVCKRWGVGGSEIMLSFFLAPTLQNSKSQLKIFTLSFFLGSS